MTVQQAIEKLKKGQPIAVPRQLSWRRAAQVVKLGHGELKQNVARWAAVLMPIEK